MQRTKKDPKLKDAKSILTEAQLQHIQSLGSKFKDEDLPDFMRLYHLREQLDAIQQKIDKAIKANDAEAQRQWTLLMQPIASQVNILSLRFLATPKARLTAKEEQRLISEEAQKSDATQSIMRQLQTIMKGD